MYYLQLAKHRLPCNMIKSSKNKKNAIEHAKRVALHEKCSVVIYRTINEGIKIRDLVFIGIVEFPYYLRDLPLDERDLTLNF